MSRLPLFLALFAFFILGAALIARTPIGASPDESAHWQYVEYLVANHALPIFKGEVPPAPGYEFHQPPLYYAAVAPGWSVLPPGVQNYWARLVSLLCGLATLFFIWKSARLLFPDERSIAIIATGFAALWPLHLSVSAGANNDAMGGLWAAALFWVGARVLIQGASWRDAALLGVFVGLGALTKNTVLVVGLAALAALFVAPRANEKAPSRVIGLLVALATMTVLAGPLWARNMMLYGDPFALAMFSQAANVSPGAAQFESIGIGPFKYWSAMGSQIFMTTWGFFGGPNSALAATKPLTPNGPIVTDFRLQLLMFCCFLAPILALLGWRNANVSLEISASQKRVLWFFMAGFALVALAWLQFAHAHFAGGQARYFHAALLPMSVLLAVGWRGLWGNGRALLWASLGMAAVLVALTALNLLVWKTLV